MHRKHCTMPILAVGVLCVGLMFAPARAFPQTPRAKVVHIEGATTTYKIEDMGGKMIEVEVPSTSLTDLRTDPAGTASTSAQSGQATGTISAKVVAVDTQTNKVKVVTQAGQTVELEMATQGVQIGDQFTLVIPR